MSFLQVDIAAFKAQWADMLAAYPELSEDDDLRADMLEGSTDIAPLVSRMVRMMNERKALAEGLSGYIGDLQERKARELRGADGLKALLKSLMLAADLPKLILPEATVSITKPRVTVEITDEAALPQGFVKIERTAKKSEIKAALEAGDEIPGARLGLSDEGLMVRTK